MKPDVINYNSLTRMDNAWAVVKKSALHGVAWPLTGLSVEMGVFLALLATDLRGLIAPTLLFLILMRQRAGSCKHGVCERFATDNGWSIDTMTALSTATLRVEQPAGRETELTSMV